MKKILLILLTVGILVPASALAQSYPVDRGSVILGGSASLISTDTGSNFTDERTITLTINPSAQFFVIPNLALGGTAGFFLLRFDDETDAAALLGPTLSYYAGGPDQRFYPFVSGSLQFDVEEFDDSATLLLEGGGAYMVARTVALTGSLSFSGLLDDLGDQNIVGLRFGVSAFLF